MPRGGARTLSDLAFRDDTEASRYEAHLGDGLVGDLDYHAQPGLVTLLHTEVPRAFEEVASPAS